MWRLRRNCTIIERLFYIYGKSTVTDKAFFERTTIGKPENLFDSYCTSGVERVKCQAVIPVVLICFPCNVLRSVCLLNLKVNISPKYWKFSSLDL